jgi:hypothetical protein
MTRIMLAIGMLALMAIPAHAQFFDGVQSGGGGISRCMPGSIAKDPICDKIKRLTNAPTKIQRNARRKN